MNTDDITLEDIRRAHCRIKSMACHTPLKHSINLSEELGRNIYLKMETMQHTGAFKLRGAANFILSLTKAERSRGIVTASSGNHGRAVAYISNRLGIKAAICMTTLAPQVKIDAIRRLGAEVVIYGENQNLATKKAHEIAQQQGLRFISAFDDSHVIAGQGTVGLEILQDRPEIDTIITQISGGGLASGIIIAVKSLKPEIKIIGVTSEHGAAMYESIKAGKIVHVDEAPSIADSLPGPIPADNKYTFKLCRRYLDDILKVSDEQVKSAMAYALCREKIVLEGGGAATIALLLDKKVRQLGKHVAVICSGDNVDMKKLLDITRERSDI